MADRRTPAPALPPWLHPKEDGFLLDVVVSPRSSRTRIVGVHDDRLKIQLTAPPVDGKANAALVRFLAETLDVARAQIEIVGGASARRKTVRVLGATAQRALLRLTPARP